MVETTPVTETPKPDGRSVDMVPTEPRFDAEKPGENEGAEFSSEEYRKRLADAAVGIALASVVLPVALVLLVAWSLIQSSHLSVIGPPALAGLTAIGIIGFSYLGGIHRKTQLSFGPLIAGTIGIGVVVIGTMLVLFSTSSEEAASPAGTIEIVADEFEFDATSWSVAEGNVTFIYESAGKIGHTLTIEGKEDDLLLQVSPSFEVDSESLVLDEGTYILYCDVKGHRELGMEGTLTVTHASDEDEGTG